MLFKSILKLLVHYITFSQIVLRISAFNSDAVFINASDISFDHSYRNKRELSTMKRIRNLEECGKVKGKPTKLDKGSSLEAILMQLITSTVLNRKQIDIESFPWITALVMTKNNGLFYCGGALLDHWHVVTAASCVARMIPEDLANLKVLLGTNDIYNSYELNRIESKVSQVAYHKGFDSINMENNIALIKLREPISYSEFIQPICLSNGSNIYENNNALASVAGWGQLISDPLNSLHKLDVRIWDKKRCVERYNQRKFEEYFPEIRDDSLCAHSPISRSKSLCQGNNGSPLVLKRNRRFELIGITSWGVGGDKFPCVFTRVDKHIAWIQRTIASFL